MRYLTDTNVLLSLSEPTRADHDDVRVCVRALSAQKNPLCYTTQILGEFWSASTRPLTSRGGLGLSISETDRRVRLIESQFVLLAENPQTHIEWRRLIIDYAVTGVSVYDAWLVATMQVFGITHLLTRNKKDFSRYSGIITAVSAEDINNGMPQLPLA